MTYGHFNEYKKVIMVDKILKYRFLHKKNTEERVKNASADKV